MPAKSAALVFGLWPEANRLAIILACRTLHHRDGDGPMGSIALT